MSAGPPRLDRSDPATPRTVHDGAVASPDVEPVSILLVDDRASNLASLEAVLTQPDYNLVLARSGPEALTEVLRNDFVVILLDVAMPGMDGFETASIIKQREQSRLIPIIFVTASVYEMEHIFRGYTVGAVDYLRKPVDPHAVRAKVSVFVELYRERRRNVRQAGRLQAAERQLRERAEDALRESEAIYQATFEQAPVGIGHGSPDGRWTKANARLGAIVGRAPGELVGAPLSSVVADEGAPALREALESLRTGRADVYSAEHLLASSGLPAWAHVTISAWREPGGALRRFIAVVTDLSERRAVEIERSRLVTELREAVRSRDDFLALLAHELKTPLTPLRLQTSALLRELERGSRPAEAQLRRRLEEIDASSARLDELMNDLLDASQSRVGTMALELEPVDLAALVHDVVAHHAAAVAQGRCSVEVHADEPVHGRWDRVRLAQMLSGLLSNAVKYGAGKAIEIRAGREGEVARLSVQDHGIGIPEAAQARLFERYDRLVPARHYGGFGLGLWMVRQIARAHGGRASVVSKPGEGATFTVELPLEPLAAPSPPSGGRS